MLKSFSTSKAMTPWGRNLGLFELHTRPKVTSSCLLKYHASNCERLASVELISYVRPDTTSQLGRPARSLYIPGYKECISPSADAFQS